MIDRKRLTIAELGADFTVDDSGALYWRGKRVRTGGLTPADRIAIVSAAIAFLSALAAIAGLIHPAKP